MNEWQQLGYDARKHVDESARMQANNEGPWLVLGHIDGRLLHRTCQNWAGARLAMSLLEKKGARFIRYSRDT